MAMTTDPGMLARGALLALGLAWSAPAPAQEGAGGPRSGWYALGSVQRASLDPNAVDLGGGFSETTGDAYLFGLGGGFRRGALRLELELTRGSFSQRKLCGALTPRIQLPLAPSRACLRNGAKEEVLMFTGGGFYDFLDRAGRSLYVGGGFGVVNLDTKAGARTRTVGLTVLIPDLSHSDPKTPPPLIPVQTQVGPAPAARTDDGTHAAYFWELGVSFPVSGKQELVLGYRQLRARDARGSDYAAFRLGYRFW